MEEEVVIAHVWIKCKRCLQLHKLFAGIEAPFYWCGNEIFHLVEGDEIEYEG